MTPEDTDLPINYVRMKIWVTMGKRSPLFSVRGDSTPDTFGYGLRHYDRIIRMYQGLGTPRCEAM